MSRDVLDTLPENFIRDTVVVQMRNIKNPMYGTLFKVYAINKSETLLWIYTADLSGSNEYIVPISDCSLVAGNLKDIKYRLPDADYNMPFDLEKLGWFD